MNRAPVVGIVGVQEAVNGCDLARLIGYVADPDGHMWEIGAFG